jgi:alpha,alpha-trehalase
MVMEVYEATSDMPWLKSALKIIESELQNYWLDSDSASRHRIYKGLSRYCDHAISHVYAEHESGWDSTSRFQDRALDFLPVDLNSCLYRYEADIARIYILLGKKRKAEKYLESAQKRKDAMDKLMWSSSEGLFFDFDHIREEAGAFKSIAAYYTLWSGLADKAQAKGLVRSLKHFEHDGGLANTQKEGLSEPFRQWDYPNGWANQHYIVVKGLLDYGFVQDAHRIAKKWLDLNTDVFEVTGQFWEKYNVAKRDVGIEGRYRNQTGFAWTNSVYIRLQKLLDASDQT